MEKENNKNFNPLNILKLVRYYLVSYWKSNCFVICLRIIPAIIIFALSSFIFIGVIKYVSNYHIDNLNNLDSQKEFLLTEGAKKSFLFSESNLIDFAKKVQKMNLFELYSVSRKSVFKNWNEDFNKKKIDFRNIKNCIKNNLYAIELVVKELKRDRWKVCTSNDEIEAENIFNKWSFIINFYNVQTPRLNNNFKEKKKLFLITSTNVINTFFPPIWSFFFDLLENKTFNKRIYFKKDFFDLFAFSLKAGFFLISGFFCLTIISSCLVDWWKESDSVVILFGPGLTRTDMFLAKSLSFYCLLVILFFSVIGYPMIMHWILFDFEFIPFFRLLIFIFCLLVLAPICLFFLVFSLMVVDAGNKALNFIFSILMNFMFFFDFIMSCVLIHHTDVWICKILVGMNIMPFLYKFLFVMCIGIICFLFFFIKTKKEDIKGE